MSAPFPPYFPPGLFGERVGGDDYLGSHVVEVLSALHEGPLYQKAEEPPFRVYRFTWIRSFHPAVVIALRFGPHLPAYLRVLRLRQKSLIPQFSHPETRGRVVADEIVDRVVQTFRRVEFLKLSPYRSKLALDGAMWIVEAVEPGIYHAVYRHSPKEGPIRELGLEFLSIAGLCEEEVY